MKNKIIGRIVGGLIPLIVFSALLGFKSITFSLVLLFYVFLFLGITSSRKVVNTEVQ